jgi:hypothetical protein
MNPDAYEFLHCSVDVLVLIQSDQPDTERNAPSHRLRNIRSRASVAPRAVSDLVVNLCARGVVAGCEADARLSESLPDVLADREQI